MSLDLITRLPLRQLPAPFENVAKKRDLLREDVRELLRLGPVQFLVADVGCQLQIIDVSKCFEFWKVEVQSHLSDTSGSRRLEDFLGEYYYFASEWMGGLMPIVLLSKTH